MYEGQFQDVQKILLFQLYCTNNFTRRRSCAFSQQVEVLWVHPQRASLAGKLFREKGLVPKIDGDVNGL